MVIKRHKEIRCDICNSNIGRDFLLSRDKRVVRIKCYNVECDGKLEINKNIDLCWSCYSDLMREVKANVPTQIEV